MAEITLTFPDGSTRTFEQGVTGQKVAESIGPRLAKEALCIKIDDVVLSLDEPLENDAKIEILTFDSPEGIYAFRHSTCHILADAITRLYPNAKPTIGPPVDEGFYYDFDDLELKEEDLQKIEDEMKKIIKEDDHFQRKEVSLDEVKQTFAHNPYKVEMAEEYAKDGKKLTVVSHGNFTDLCGNPHITSTGKLKAIKLMKLAGAYWRGDAKNKQLTRIYGISFPKESVLKEHIHMLEEAEKRDHRKIGKDLDLFSFNDVSPGCPFFHPKGTIIYNGLIDFIRGEYKKRGYQEVITPTVFHNELWKTSGHWEHFKENMFITKMDNDDAALKPMNCPSHCMLYKRTVHSYRELPLRVADFGILHRNELRGTLGGLMRVRKFQQDDSHIFTQPENIQSEVLGVIDFVRYVYKDVFGFDFHVELSTKPDKAMGDPALWENAEKALAQALEQNGMEYKLNPGDGAFYGPKIDFHIKDAIGRTWQCATIQLDFNLPERFDLTYEGDDGKKHRLIMIHRAIFGSIERFLGVLTEHYAGKFPLWLSPAQVKIIVVANKFDEYANTIAQKYHEAGLRVETDLRAETIGKKIREAQLEQVNYILVVGEKEEANNTVNVRTRDNEVHGEKNVDEFLAQLKDEIEKKD